MIRRFRHWAASLVAGTLVLALVTWACFQFGLNVATTGFGFLIVIILLSLFDSFVSSVLFSIIAVGCLDYFFMEPLFSFTVASIEDLMALGAFLIASITITSLVRRSRRVGEALMDVTAARRTDEELHKVQAELAHVIRVTTLGELAASLAHEITQPIAAARNNARAALNFLGQQPPDLGEAKEALGYVLDTIDRTGEIIQLIRDQIKKAPPRTDHFDLNKAVNEVLVLARSAITKHGVSVQTRFADGTASVGGDRVQLQQVVLNLVLNAVEAMGSVEGGKRELLISIEQTQVNGMLVAVRDLGPGIDPERLDRIFEAFYTTKSNGIGMGLSICRSIIIAHGGRLWAEANEPQGAAFLFTLPEKD
jgi:C4-dicarboxylate-specific signal transduction histidine kinase